jgi:hypothetical protein
MSLIVRSGTIPGGDISLTCSGSCGLVALVAQNPDAIRPNRKREQTASGNLLIYYSFFRSIYRTSSAILQKSFAKKIVIAILVGESEDYFKCPGGLVNVDWRHLSIHTALILSFIAQIGERFHT